MRTWGDIKNAAIAKLDLSSSDITGLGYINRFAIFANEAMTQICSTVKPDKKTFDVTIVDRDDMIHLWNDLVDKYGIYEKNVISEKPERLTTVAERSFWKEWESFIFTGQIVKVDDDLFVSFNDDVPTIDTCDGTEEAHDDDIIYRGYNRLTFCKPGTYHVGYNARWYTFPVDCPDDLVIDAPDDVLDCLPSYIVSQLFKIDDEYKASVYRNEYEVFLSRIDNTDFRNTTTLKIGGGW